MAKRLRAGDAGVAEQLINGHVRLAIYVASLYANMSPNTSEDLVSESLCGLVTAVSEAVTKLVDDNITPFIASKCHDQVYSFLVHNHTIRSMSRMQSWRRRRKSIESEVAKVLPIFGDDVPDRRAAISLLDINELLEKSVESETEAKVVAMRRLGYKDPHIAKELRCSVAAVSICRARIRERFKQLESEGEVP